MREQIGYCWEKAAECAARAEEATDKDTRELFIRFRNWWINAANRYQSAGAGAAGRRADPRLSRARALEGLTTTLRERLGAG
jgi:hypothetical protein